MREAYRALEPGISVSLRTLGEWVRASLRPVGRRETGYRGRPAYTYRRSEVEALAKRKGDQ